MGGHGLYVWLCYGVSLFIFVVISIQPVLAKINLVKELKQIQRRKKADDFSAHEQKSGEA